MFQNIFLSEAPFTFFSVYSDLDFPITRVVPTWGHSTEGDFRDHLVLSPLLELRKMRDFVTNASNIANIWQI